jgi:hypothetical protein
MIGGGLIGGGGRARGLGRVTRAGGERHEGSDDEAWNHEFFHNRNGVMVVVCKVDLFVKKLQWEITAVF